YDRDCGPSHHLSGAFPSHRPVAPWRVDRLGDALCATSLHGDRLARGASHRRVRARPRWLLALDPLGVHAVVQRFPPVDRVRALALDRAAWRGTPARSRRTRRPGIRGRTHTTTTGAQ